MNDIKFTILLQWKLSSSFVVLDIHLLPTKQETAQDGLFLRTKEKGIRALYPPQ